MVPEHAETDRNAWDKNVIEKETVKYKFCTDTIYRRADEKLKSHSSGFGRDQISMRLS